MNAPAKLQGNDITRLRLRVRGAVQGVGFRPFAYGLAKKLDLAGFVRNDAEGVFLEIEGLAAAAFVDTLRKAPPPLARIDSIEIVECAATGVSGFSIDATRSGKALTRIGADAAVCEDCLDELFDPSSRFYRYPLVNCTHCGPRYTLTRELPYDRAQTSMAPFAMCEDCERDYKDPANRRFHAEPIACPRCGPNIDLSVETIAERIAAGDIVAVKGVGGYHLICDARNEATVARLRMRKAREAKPFAVMVLNEASAERIAEVSDVERAMLTNRAAPIVLMKAKGNLAPAVAPRLGDIGVMLPYTPLHWLIMQALAGKPDFAAWRRAPSDLALVATSANFGGEPLIANDEEAKEKLAGVADLVVTHARKIVVRADDSVMRALDGAPAYIRRARGFVPDPIDLGIDGPCVLAHGADLKNTITLTRGREAFVSQYLGDLDDRETIRFRQETIKHLQSILCVEPEIVACDLHPDFVSTRAAEASGLRIVAVQHHVAHIAGVAAEQGWREGVLGVALDGFGFGDDGASWGGELIALDGANWRRVGHLEPLALPGGDKAAREPWRMGVAVLHKLGRGSEAAKIFPQIPEARRLAESLQRGARATVTTSLGRMFDAIAGLAGVCHVQHYEGQAAMELEALVTSVTDVTGLSPSPLAGEGGRRLDEGLVPLGSRTTKRPLTPDPSPARGEGSHERSYRITNNRLDLTPFAARVIDERMNPRESAEGFHGLLIAALHDWITTEAQRSGRKRIALSGGCVMNRVLTDGLCAALRADHLEVAIPRKTPANDGGISFGQAAFALNAL